VNIGNPGEFTILELAEKVLHLTGSKSRLVHMPKPQDDPAQRKPDITLAQSKLGWQPQVALDDGLKETVAYFRKLLGP
jgi:UDP-glucuronate decarboxylase